MLNSTGPETLSNKEGPGGDRGNRGDLLDILGIGRHGKLRDQVEGVWREEC